MLMCSYGEKNRPHYEKVTYCIMETELCINYFSAGCASLTPDADLCCAVKMRNSDITERFKAFRVRDQQHISFNILLYPSYSDLSISPHRIGIQNINLTVDSLVLYSIKFHSFNLLLYEGAFLLLL